MSFAAVEVVGGLLTPDVLNRVAESDSDAETRRAYGVAEGLDLRDEIARAWRMAEARWAIDYDAAKADSDILGRRFVPWFLKEILAFDDLDQIAPVEMGERRFPIGHAARSGRVPVVIAPVADAGQRGSGLDVRHGIFADGNRRRSATLLLQEYLNAEDNCLWGIATDGLTLRLLRDNLSLTRPAWVEIDFARIFNDGLYADFGFLWLLLHASRFGPADAAPSDSALESWREQGREEGVAAREDLRHGVEEALRLLGGGAMKHPDNNALREALRAGTLSAQGLYEELLGTVYRLIFLLVAEDRDLLHPLDASPHQRSAYVRGYGMDRLRARALRRSSWDRHHDAWDGLRAVFRTLAEGAPALGLPALGGLFDPGRTPHLDEARISNRFVMETIFRLAWLRPQGRALTRINWRDMRTEELGSVYEGLLELVPEASVEKGSFGFRDVVGVAGTERRTTGSYYTPEALVSLVLDSTLEPLLDRAAASGDGDPEQAVSAILDLNILDPACGSGHFLLGAAHRAAARIANLRSPGAPGHGDYQHALREVISNMINGVDRNPLAVELCKVALWIEALEPGQPLSFLDSRIRCGDSLVGIQDLESLTSGIPDDAYKALTGDDREAARKWHRWNKEQCEGGAAAGMLEDLRPPANMLEKFGAFAAMPEDSVADIAAKRRTFERVFGSEARIRLKRACDLCVAAFFTVKAPLPDALTPAETEHIALAEPSVPLTGHVWTAARGQDLHVPLVDAVEALCLGLRAFHWPLEFPVVLERGGFDAVIGNPPWERIKLQEQEFFASRAPEIAAAKNATERRRMIKALGEAPEGSAERLLFKAFQGAKRGAEAESAFARSGVRFPLTGIGDVNTYALFAETFLSLIRPDGRAGMIVPTGLITDYTYRHFFRKMLDEKRLQSAFDFENRQGIFPEVHRSYKFSILGIAPSDKAEFAFFLQSPTDLENKERRFVLTPEQIARINPNTRTAPVFRSHADAELTNGIYERVPVLIREGSTGDVNSWGIRFQRMFDMANDSDWFRTADQLIEAGWSRDGTDWLSGDGTERVVPLYEAKMVHHFDHRWATYAGTDATGRDETRDATSEEKSDPDFEVVPRYWVPKTEVWLRAARISPNLKSAVRESSEDKALKALAEHVAAAWPDVHGRPATDDDLGTALGRDQLWQSALGTTLSRWLAEPATSKALTKLQRESPVTGDDLDVIASGAPGILDKARLLIELKQPRWLMGQRLVTNATNERTVVGGVLPYSGVGNSLSLCMPLGQDDRRFPAVLAALLSSLPLDFTARQKVGGINLNFFIIEQLPVLRPADFGLSDLDFIAPRVLELTYTSHAMRPWAEDLGHTGPPFAWEPNRRMQLRADLDGFFARKYGLSRDQLRYVLDPADVHGPDYPSETFRGLRDKEIARFGEYRTRRLVLEAYDRMERVG